MSQRDSGGRGACPLYGENVLGAFGQVLHPGREADYSQTTSTRPQRITRDELVYIPAFSIDISSGACAGIVQASETRLSRTKGRILSSSMVVVKSSREIIPSSRG